MLQNRQGLLDCFAVVPGHCSPVIPPECNFIEIAPNVLLTEPVKDPELGSFKLGVERFGGVVVNLATGEFLLAVVDI